MAKLAAGEPVRFTPEQRDALIEMAARLQAEHEGTVGSDELARAAAEAGIDPRFLGEAAARFDAAPSVVATDLRGPLAAMVGLAALNLWFLLGRSSFTHSVEMSPRAALFMGVSAFVLALVACRQRAIRWVAPLGVVAVWLTLTIGLFFFSRLSHSSRGWVFPTALAACLVQAFAATVAAGLSTLQDAPRRRF